MEFAFGALVGVCLFYWPAKLMLDQAKESLEDALNLNTETLQYLKRDKEILKDMRDYYDKLTAIFPENHDFS